MVVILSLTLNNVLMFLHGNFNFHYSVYFLTKCPNFFPSVYGIGKRALSDAWALDTAQKPYVWQRLNPDGDRPSARMLVI